MVFSAPLTIRRMSTSNPHRMAKGSRCIFFVINRPKSSSESVGIRVAPPPRSDGRFIRRLIERVLGRDRSWATSSTSVALFFGNCSISEDSVFPAVWLLLEGFKTVIETLPGQKYYIWLNPLLVLRVRVRVFRERFDGFDGGVVWELINILDKNTIRVLCPFRFSSLLNMSSVVRVVEVTNNWWAAVVFVVVSGAAFEDDDSTWFRSQWVCKLVIELLNEHVFWHSLHLAWPLPMSSKWDHKSMLLWELAMSILFIYFVFLW